MQVPYKVTWHVHCTVLFMWYYFYSGALVAQRASKRSPILIWERKGNPWVDFLMVIMASGIARGRVRTTTTTTATATAELPNMAATLQIIGWQRHAALVYRVLLWYWTSMLWSTFHAFSFQASLLLFRIKGPVIDAHSLRFHFGRRTKTSEYNLTVFLHN